LSRSSATNFLAASRGDERSSHSLTVPMATSNALVLTAGVDLVGSDIDSTGQIARLRSEGDRAWVQLPAGPDSVFPGG